MPEIAIQFFIMGIVSGVIGVIFKLNDMKLNDIAISFKDGAKDLIGAALVVAMAQGIMQVLGGSDPTTPTVINTIMYNISNALLDVIDYHIYEDKEGFQAALKKSKTDFVVTQIGLIDHDFLTECGCELIAQTESCYIYRFDYSKPRK